MNQDILIQLFALDDDESIRMQIMEALMPLPYVKVQIFDNHVQFFENFNKHVHIAIVDHSLDGGVNGFDVLSNILDINPACKVIIITGNEDPRLIIKYFKKKAFQVQLKGEGSFKEELIDNVNEAYNFIFSVLSYYQGQIESLNKIETRYAKRLDRVH